MEIFTLEDKRSGRAAPGDRLEHLTEECIASLTACSQTCTEVVDVWLGDERLAAEGTLVRAGLECAGTCQATIKLLARRTGYAANLLRPMLGACATVAKRCRLECQSRTAPPELGRMQEEARRKCEQACLLSEHALARLLDIVA